MAHGCGLTSVRGNRGENHEKGTAGSPKTYKEKKDDQVLQNTYSSILSSQFFKIASYQC
jgi:hypothetical protein